MIIVASVSCIYALGDPEECGQGHGRAEARASSTGANALLRHLVSIHYERNDFDLKRGTFRVRGDTLEIVPAYGETAYRVGFWGDEIERITEIDPLTGEVLAELDELQIFPAKHFVTAGGQARAGPGRHRGRTGGAAGGAKGARRSCWRPSGWSSAPSTIWR